MPNGTCCVTDCETRPLARSLCSMHYQRWKNGGDVEAGPMARGRWHRTHAEIFTEAPKETMPNGCIEWRARKTASGYGSIRSKVYGNTGAHRVAYAIAHGPIPADLLVCHACDNPLCVNVAHLFLGDNQANASDKVAKRRQKRGEQAPSARLTEREAREILARYSAGGILRRELAAEYGVSPGCIQKLTERRSWRCLDDNAA